MGCWVHVFVPFRRVMGKSWSFVSGINFYGNLGLEIVRGETVTSLLETGSKT